MPRLFVLKVIHSFWFIPSLLAGASVLTSILLQSADRWLELEPSGSLSWLFTSSADGARSLLSTIAGSIITVTGVLLSAIIVVMTLASQQYGPRLVQNFINDRVGQIVIGCFVGCFVYSVLTLKSIQSGEIIFLPHLSILGALLYSLLCIALLIFFVQHLASSIQVQSIMRRVSLNLNAEIDHLFPEALGHEPSDDVSQSKTDSKKAAVSTEIKAHRSGYLQSIDYDQLMNLSKVNEFVIHLKAMPGEFLIHQATIAELETKAAVEEPQETLKGCFIIGTYPTCDQDVLFPIRQLSEIAIRALSPGINDPHTAIEAIDYLASSLAQLINRDWPSQYRYDSDQALRITTRSPSFETILRQAYQQIHHYGLRDVTIVTRLLEVLATIAAQNTTATERIAVIRSFAHEICEKSSSTIEAQSDITAIKKTYHSCFPNN
ncbi:DUF2254 domain-containing protein [Lentimonas sp. CC4]|nr:DUF2254 domain-containing protein [Lentimonas sp. CC4]